MGASRQLAVIMFTDVVGYSALMSEDEHRALDILKQNKDIHESLLLKIDGKLLKEMGDGMLLSFNNATDAVKYASTLQHFTGQQHYQLRIGIHLGEVVFENGDVFGAGVNIASRLEPLAQPGEVVVSEDVSHNLENKPGFHSEYLDKVTLKNIPGQWKLFKAYVDDKVIEEVIASPSKKVARDPAKSPSWIPQIIKWMAIGFIGIALGVGLWMSTGSGQLVEGLDNATVRKLREMTIAVLPFEGPASGALSEFGAMAPYWIERRLKEVATGKVVDVGDAKTHEDIDSGLIERTGLEGVIQGRYFVSSNPDSILELYINFIYLDTREKLELGYFAGSVNDPEAVLDEGTQRIMSIWALSDRNRWAENPPRYDAFKLYNQAAIKWFENTDQAFQLLEEAFNLDSTLYDAKLKSIVYYNQLGEREKSDSILLSIEKFYDQMDYWTQLRIKSMKAYLHDGDLEQVNKYYLEMVNFDPFSEISLVNAINSSLRILKPQQALDLIDKYIAIGSSNDIICNWPAGWTAEASFLLEDYDKIQQLVDLGGTEACPYHNPMSINYQLRSLVRKNQMNVIDSLIPVYVDFLIEEKEDKRVKNNIMLLPVIQELALMGKEEQMLEFITTNKYFPIMDGIPWFLPHSIGGYNWYYSLTGDHQRALSVTDSMYRQDTTRLINVADLAIFSAQSGDTIQAQRWLEKLESQPVGKYSRGYLDYMIAQVKSAMGRRAEAMEHIESAYAKGFEFSPDRYQGDYALKNLFDYPPFLKFVEPRG